MGVFDSISEVSDKAQDSGERYAKASKAYYKLKVFKVITKSSSKLTKILVIGGLFFLASLFILIAGTIWLANTLQNFSLAFLIVGSILLIIGVIAYLIRKSIDRLIIRKVSEDFFD